MNNKMESSTPVLPERVPLLDVTRGNAPIMEEIMGEIREICEAGLFVGGKACQDFEQAIADYCQTPYAVGCASGSDALLVALMAFDIGPGDEVLLPSFTFFATASCVTRLGGTPVWVDVDPETYNIDLQDLQAKITKQSKAIIPVHLFGQCADMDAIMELANEHNLIVIEDAAQAIGATYKGKPAGSIGHVGCFSFYPTKNLGGFGDGGIMTATDESIADRLRLFANHGMRPRYHHKVVGVNSRLDAIQAVALRIKLQHLDQWAAGRCENAKKYDQWLAQSQIQQFVTGPTTDPDYGHVWNQYTIRIAGGIRDDVRSQLMEAGVGSEVYYPIPLHQQDCYASLAEATKGTLPVTEQLAEEVLSLPIFAELTEGEIQKTMIELEKAVLNCAGSKTDGMRKAS